MALLQLLFGFSGRIPRLHYWFAYLIWLFVAAAIFFVIKVVMIAADQDGSAVMMFTLGLLIYLPFMASALAVGLKRLHDRDKSAWWLAFYWLTPVALSLLIYAIAGLEPENSDVASKLQFLVLGIYIWMLIDLGCLRGTRGPNRFGPDPLGTA